MNAQEALAQVEALCSAPTDIGLPRGRVSVNDVRAVLAQVQVQPEPVALDRDKAREVLNDPALVQGLIENLLDALAACVVTR